jgi:predicted TIM-barrel fold metal-dependent hydrolase
MPPNGHAARSYRLIDADSHVNEPPDLWQSRVPAAYRDRAPHMERFDDGDAWVLEGVSDPITFGLNATAGLAPGEMRQWVRWEDIRRGGWDPAARLAEMDTDGIDAQILYPTPRLSHSIIANQDPDFHLSLVRAYNDWLGEYCAHAPHRLGGLVMIPNRGVAAAVAELERAMQLPGMVGALVTCYPHGDLDIRPEDDPVWRAVAQSGYPLHIHVSMINEMPGAHKAKVVGAVRFWDAPTRILQLVQTGVFDRIPDLQVVVTETDCGWVPYLKEQADDRFHRLDRGAATVERLPSDYIADHFSFTYITDHYGIRNRHDIGVERILWSSDYPHVGADWPNSWRTIAGDFSGVDRAERDLILAGNAERLYRFSGKVGTLRAVEAVGARR